MNRFLTRLVMALAALSLGAGAAWADPSSEHLRWGSHVTPARCTDDGYRYLGVNVTHKVINDGDRGSTRFWASLDYNKHIQVWEVGAAGGGYDERFCALVRYQGAWISTAGVSPGANSEETSQSVAAGVEGTFEGGYRAVVTGKLRQTPAHRTRGNLGSFDYGWNGNPAGGATTPFDWIDTYFEPGATLTLEWWGWVYHGGSNGTWVHACDPAEGPECEGSSGNITD